MQENKIIYSSSSLTIPILLISFFTVLTTITVVIVCLRRKQKKEDNNKEEVNSIKEDKNESEIKILNGSLSKVKSQDTISLESSTKSKIPVRKKIDFNLKPKGFLKEKITPQDNNREVKKPIKDNTEFTRINEKSPPVNKDKFKEKNLQIQLDKQKMPQEQDTILRDSGTEKAKQKLEKKEPKIITTIRPPPPKALLKQDLSQNLDESIQSIDINTKFKKKEQEVKLDMKKLKGIIKKVRHDRSRQNGKVTKRSVKFFTKVEVWARTPTLIGSEKSFGLFDDYEISTLPVNAANARWFPNKIQNQQQSTSYAFRFRNKQMIN
jgi:hypothetical protein